MSHKPHLAALDNADLRLLEAGAHAQPFRVLGVQPSARGRMLRVNAPGAWRVEARDREDRSLLTVLNQSQSPGLFAGALVSERPYTLRIYWPGRVEDGEDPYAFAPTEGAETLLRLRDKRARGVADLLGGALHTQEGVPGAQFAVFAPHAASVALVGDFNGWDDRRHPMVLHGETGTWRLFAPRVEAGAQYAFALRSQPDSTPALMPDPFARQRDADDPGRSILCAPAAPHWRDERWLAMRRARRETPPPRSIYRMEPAAWLGEASGGASWALLEERAPAYLGAMGFTHVLLRGESGDWLFAPPPKLGAAEAFARFVDACHDAGVGVLIEWSGADVFSDEGASPQWAALRQNAAVDSAMFWLETFHVDGLSIPHAGGLTGELLKRLRDEIDEHAPGAEVFVEEACAVAAGYASVWAPELALAPEQAFEVGAPGDALVTPFAPHVLAGALEELSGLAALRARLAVAWMLAGSKLMHMGAELAQTEWTSGAVEWDRLDRRECVGMLRLVRDLNAVLRAEAPVRLTSRMSQHFAPLNAGDDAFAFLRAADAAPPLLVALNRTATAQRVALEAPAHARWRELVNTDSVHYGGDNIGNCGVVEARRENGGAALDIMLPPNGALILRGED